ncbi:MAG: hypothetical protein BroJett040_04360 [Oligoflexia bacterium]|nr:MAG: hypothetical protein BroJett040_04360 [Oligoflexia bacterium]
MDYRVADDQCVPRDGQNQNGDSNQQAMCSRDLQSAKSTCSEDNPDMKKVKSDMERLTAGAQNMKMGGAIDQCSPVSSFADAADVTLATVKANCAMAARTCESSCADDPASIKECRKAGEQGNGLAMNATRAAVSQFGNQCKDLMQKLSSMGNGMGSSGGGMGSAYLPSNSNLGSVLPGMKSGSQAYASKSADVIGGSTSGISKKGLGATDLGALMNGEEDGVYGTSQTAAGKAGGSGGGSGLGGNSGGGGGGPGKQQKGVASRPGLNTNIHRGYVGSSAMPGFGGPGGAGTAGGGVGGPNGRPGIGPNGQQPDWRKFLPGGQYDPRRGIAGVTGPDGITGPATNLFDKVHNRYGAVGHTLKP